MLEYPLPSAQEAQDYQDNFHSVASQQGVALLRWVPSLPRPKQPPLAPRETAAGSTSGTAPLNPTQAQQPPFPVWRLLLDPLLDEDRQFSIDSGNEVVLRNGRLRQRS